MTWTSVTASLWPEMSSRGVGSVLLVGLAVLMVLGHICAPPFHAHAGAITTHEEHESHHGGEHPDDDTAHAGSCDVVKSAAPALDGVVLTPLPTIPLVTAGSPGQHVDSDSALVFGSPPLFLLHAALLI